MLKLTIHLHANDYSKTHAQQRRRSIGKLEGDLQEVNETLASDPSNENLLSCRARLDLTLANYYTDIRCRVCSKTCTREFNVPVFGFPSHRHIRLPTMKGYSPSLFRVYRAAGKVNVIGFPMLYVP
jgi:hypothetical protein